MWSSEKSPLVPIAECTCRISKFPLKVVFYNNKQLGKSWSIEILKYWNTEILKAEGNRIEIHTFSFKSFVLSCYNNNNNVD